MHAEQAAPAAAINPDIQACGYTVARGHDHLAFTIFGPSNPFSFILSLHYCSNCAALALNLSLLGTTRLILSLAALIIALLSSSSPCSPTTNQHRFPPPENYRPREQDSLFSLILPPHFASTFRFFISKRLR